MNMLYFLPLAFEKSLSTIEATIAAIKTSTGASASGALALASFIVAVKLIRMGYEAMSDEQQGGFGGITLKSVLRPLLIVIAIHYSGTLLSYLDGVVGIISNSVPQKTASTIAANQTKRMRDIVITYYGEDAIERTQKAGLDYESSVKKAVENTAKMYTGTSIMGATQPAANLHAAKQEYAVRTANIYEQQVNNYLATSPEYQTKAKELNDYYYSLMTDPSVPEWNRSELRSKYEWEMRDLKKTFSDNYKYTSDELQGAANFVQAIGSDKGDIVANTSDSHIFDHAEGLRDVMKILGSGAFLSTIAEWFYDLMHFAMSTFADIALLVLSVFFPWVLCFTLLDFSKTAVWTFAFTYLSVSLYKAILNLIRFVISSCVIQVGLHKMAIEKMGEASATALLGSLETGLFINVSLYVAGFIAMTKVGTLVGMIVPGAAGGGDVAGAGAAVATTVATRVGGAAKSVAQAPGKVASVAAGGPAGGIAKGATNAIGKASGGKKS